MINASLGANYSGPFVLESLKQLFFALFNFQQATDLKKLDQQLQQYFPGEIKFVYKGRDAIELCLQQFDITQPTDGVITQAFTCAAIEEGINRAGATTIYADLDQDELNLTIETLEQAKNKNKNLKIKAVIAQHSLGHPAAIEKIKTWCQKNQVILIEDLAQSFGATDAQNKLLGSQADAIILSFGRDKILDGVTGGAVVFKKPTNQTLNFAFPSKKIILRDLSYPSLTWLIRHTYSFGFGKLIHAWLKKTNWFYSPITAPTQQITALPSHFAKLVSLQLQQLEKTHLHRQTIAQLYLTELKNLNLKIFTHEQILKTGSLLRFALLMNDWPKLMTSFSKQQIYLNDRWYRRAVDCGKTNCATTYVSGTCPNAESTAAAIINLPTHQQITVSDAQQIIAIIKNHVKQLSSN